MPILILGGAGASKAVDKELYPTTVEFFELLSEEIKSNKIFDVVKQLLESRKGKGEIIDIEEVLWILSELENFVDDINDPSSVIGWFTRGGRFFQVINQDYNLNSLIKASPHIKTRIRQLIDQIDIEVYRHYGKPPVPTQLEECWLPLLKELLTKSQWIELFTTNYDLVLEAAIQVMAEDNILSNNNISTGRSISFQPTLDTSVWSKEIDTKAMRKAGGLLTKLHGSVDWRLGEENIHVGDPLFGGNHSQQVIIYPGFKGAPETSPFNLFHNRFARILTMSDVLVFIGYAFRDEYINNLIRTNKNEKAKVFIINPVEINVPFASREYEHFPEYFNKKSVEKLMSKIDRILYLK